MNLRYGRLRSRAARVAAVLALLTLGAPLHALANPAAQTTRAFTLPDGNVLELRLWGDEYVNGWETLDGFSVIRNEATGYWEYAERAVAGQLVPTARRAGYDTPPATPHLRPSAEVVAARRQAMGAVEYTTGLRQAPPWASGTTNVLVIKVEFPADAGDPDGSQPAVPCSFTAAETQENLFGATATGPGNMTDYFDEVSFGSLDLVGTVVGCFTVTHDKNDYDDGPSDAATLVAEAIALADASVDFAPFDNDGNGEVDMVAVVYSGNGPDNGLYEGADDDVNNLWPHASSIPPVAVDGGARTVRQYYIAAELLSSAPRHRTIGVHAHEFGHKIGLPDLYDTDGSSSGVGHWCLMGSGSWTSNVPGSENGEAPAHMSAWCKWSMGWITPTDRTGQKLEESLPQAETNPYAVQLLSNPGGPDDWPGGSGEYFLIENRQRTGFDIGLDGCGLLVWHIDESRNGNATEGHSSGSHRLLDLEEADGTPQELDLDPDGSGNRGDGGDPFPGTSSNREWADGTDPHSGLYDGSETGIRMAVLSTGCETTMTISLGNQPPVADAGDDVVTECTGSGTTPVALDGSGSFDPDGDPLTYLWTAAGVVFDDPTSATPTGQFPIGTTVVTLTVDDGLEIDTDMVSVTVEDTTPPEIVCPADIVVECSSHGGTPADDPQLVPFFEGVSATDLCDDTPAISDDAPGFFDLGETVVTFTATDASGNEASCTATVTVVDTTPPEIAVAVDPSVLWPPNHKLVWIEATVEVTDICDPDPTFVLTSITSDEEDNGLGDGDFPDDIQDEELGTADVSFRLRSERSGPGDGRVYTITYTASDISGNTADGVVEVRVPHHRGGFALGALGFSQTGTELLPGASSFALVFVTVPDGPEAFDATQIADGELLVGNTAGVLRPYALVEADVNQDGHDDLVAMCSSARALEIEAASDGLDGPVGIHYRPAGGRDYRVADILALGPPIELEESWVAGADDEPDPDSGPTGAAPAKSSLTGVHPNPFRPTTIVSFALAQETPVELAVYDARGVRVRTLVKESRDAGMYKAEWDGRDERGQRLSSGMYFVRLQAGDLRSMRKVILLQ